MLHLKQVYAASPSHAVHHLRLARQARSLLVRPPPPSPFLSYLALGLLLCRCRRHPRRSLSASTSRPHILRAISKYRAYNTRHHMCGRRL